MNHNARIALFGGTFDPIHEGHRLVATQALEQAKLDQVIFLPCHTSPHKLTAHSAPIEDRLAMIACAIRDNAHFTVDDYDARQTPPSYSYRTVQHFAKKFPQAQLYWIMGFDQWEALPRWAKPEILARELIFLVFARGQSPQPREGYRMMALTGTHPASASAIRDVQSANYLNPDWLQAEVVEYIHKKQLYR